MAPGELGLAGLGADAPAPSMLQLDLLAQQLVPGVSFRHCAIEVVDLAQKLAQI